MTKAELIKALEGIPDDTPISVEIDDQIIDANSVWFDETAEEGYRYVLIEHICQDPLEIPEDSD